MGAPNFPRSFELYTHILEERSEPKQCVVQQSEASLAVSKASLPIAGKIQHSPQNPASLSIRAPTTYPGGGEMLMLLATLAKSFLVCVRPATFCRVPRPLSPPPEGWEWPRGASAPPRWQISWGT